ncbi:hypothetical protein TrST_g10543 [Triparma strigata]|uniref:C2H2-type domain-containing protein n=1 Tax=Triparma strigata TaxID=1606541 RepID=A0A9W7B0F7_9STRA|nr:hypothetical protein TrST_g10543 [Triparma strigata]
MNSLSGLATQAARAAMNNPQSQQDGLNKGQNSLNGDPAPVLVIPSQPLFRPPTPPPAIAPPLVAPIAQPVAVLPLSVCPIAAPTPSSGSHNSSISVTSDGEKAAPQHFRVVKRGRRPKTGVERDKNGRIRKSSNKMEVSHEQFDVTTLKDYEFVEPERDNQNRIIRTCDICGVYKTGNLGSLANHKSKKHGIGAPREYKKGKVIRKCCVPTCDYETDKKHNLLRHHADKHNIGITWHKCTVAGCDYKAKQGANLRTHIRKRHGESVERKALLAQNKTGGESTTTPQNISVAGSLASLMHAGGGGVSGVPSYPIIPPSQVINEAQQAALTAIQSMPFMPPPVAQPVMMSSMSSLTPMQMNSYPPLPSQPAGSASGNQAPHAPPPPPINLLASIPQPIPPQNFMDNPPTPAVPPTPAPPTRTIL